MTARNCRSLYADGGAAIAASDGLSTVAQKWCVKLINRKDCSSSITPHAARVLIPVQNLKTLQEHPKITRLTMVAANSLSKFANTLPK